jgi:hypothetical protein
MAQKMNDVKNKLFSVVVVLTVVFLSIYWLREQVYRSRLNTVNELVEKLETDVRLLNLKATQLREEMEFLNFTTYLRIKEDKEMEMRQRKISPVKPGVKNKIKRQRR